MKKAIALAGIFSAVLTAIKLAEWAEHPDRENFRRIFGV